MISFYSQEANEYLILLALVIISFVQFTLQITLNQFLTMRVIYLHKLVFIQEFILFEVSFSLLMNSHLSQSLTIKVAYFVNFCQVQNSFVLCTLNDFSYTYFQ